MGTRLHAGDVLGTVQESHFIHKIMVPFDLDACLADISPGTLYTLSSKSARPYTEARFAPGDALLFGPETRGLPAAVRDDVPEAQRLTLPMVPGSRSLNLGNAVAVVVYEAWRQIGFGGAAPLSRG